MKRPHEILRRLRIEFDYTQEDVCKWIGKTRSVYNRKETGKLTLSADEFLIILTTFHKLGPKKTTYISTDKLLLQILSDA